MNAQQLKRLLIALDASAADDVQIVTQGQADGRVVFDTALKVGRFILPLALTEREIKIVELLSNLNAAFEQGKIAEARMKLWGLFTADYLSGQTQAALCHAAELYAAYIAAVVVNGDPHFCIESALSEIVKLTQWKHDVVGAAAVIIFTMRATGSPTAGAEYAAVRHLLT